MNSLSDIKISQLNFSFISNPIKLICLCCRPLFHLNHLLKDLAIAVLLLFEKLLFRSRTLAKCTIKLLLQINLLKISITGLSFNRARLKSLLPSLCVHLSLRCITSFFLFLRLKEAFFLKKKSLATTRAKPSLLLAISFINEIIFYFLRACFISQSQNFSLTKKTNPFITFKSFSSNPKTTTFSLTTRSLKNFHPACKTFTLFRPLNRILNESKIIFYASTSLNSLRLLLKNLLNHLHLYSWQKKIKFFALFF